MTQRCSPLARAAFGAATLTILSSTPALAAQCNEPFEMVVAQYEATGNNPVMLNDDEIGAAMEQFELTDVSRGFYVEIEAHILLGLEVDGCLLPPILMVQPLRPMRLSGATVFGMYA